MKTLHPAIHGGLLARRDLPAHMEELKDNEIQVIDLVAVNLYPFVETVSREGITMEQALENIDIGGPTMLRAAAKNFPGVIVLVDPTDYQPVLGKLKAGEVDLPERKRLAQKAFQHVAAYDTAIAQYLRQGEAGLPDQMTIALTKRYDLRYGENPHQPAAFYAEQMVGASSDSGITWAEQLWGKQLSFNNILDADAAWATAIDFSAPTVAIIKHTNPCCLASHEDIAEAYRRALTGDPVSAFGGIVAANRPLTKAAATEIVKTFYEIVIAPEYEAGAVEILKKKKNLRILKAYLPPYINTRPGYLDYRRVRGGLLVQASDSLTEDNMHLTTATLREPTDDELAELLFAWRAVKHIKSNAIALVKDKTLLGMGAGQPNRVVSVKIAWEKAGKKSRGSVMASDAMFPFPDSVELAAQAGVTAIIQPGGSKKDDESIKAADKYDIAMVFTGSRHFWH